MEKPVESVSKVSRGEALPLQWETGALDSELRGKKKNGKYHQIAEVNRHFTCLCEKIPVKIAGELPDEPKELLITYFSI